MNTCIGSIINDATIPTQDIEIANDEVSSNIIHILMVLYVLLACVMMLNMLIALLNNTFEKIQDNCDIEWKNARSELLKVFEMYHYWGSQCFFCFFEKSLST